MGITSMINGLRHHEASILRLKLHFLLKSTFPKNSQGHSQWGTAIIMSSLAQSKSTIDCRCRACLHVHQSVYSSASCRARDRAAPTFGFSKAQWVGASIHLHACRRTHSGRSRSHAAAPYLIKNDTFQFYLQWGKKNWSWRALKPVDTFTNLFTIQNSPVAKHINKSWEGTSEFS